MDLRVLDLGTMGYAEALELQRGAARARISGDLESDLLILVEHPPVVTLGRNSRATHLGVSAEYLAAQGIELFEVERGGDVTFHGPGQLVGYPILNLQGLRPDLHWYLRQLEASLIRALETMGLPAQRNPGQTGVWTTGRVSLPSQGSDRPEGHPEAGTALRKIASIGVHAREWVTWHGFALNVSTDLGYFDLMVPCGIPGVRMTSAEAELGQRVDMATVKGLVVDSLTTTFGFGGVTQVDRSSLRFAESPVHHGATP